MSLTQERLKELLTYCSKTGIFYWSAPRKRIRAGQQAGSSDAYGYTQICLDQKVYKAHRLAWLYVTGNWPANEIDHIDMNKANNAFINLRDATRQQNAANRRGRIGLKGAHLDPRRGVYQARIFVGRKNLYLGTFKTERGAHEAYCMKARELYGEFARAA